MSDNDDSTDGNGQDPAGPGKAPPGAGAGALTAVNPQILDAVKQTAGLVAPAAGNTGVGIAYQKVSQSAALAVQDAGDFMRNLMTISATATGVAVSKMVEDPEVNVPLYTPVVEEAQAIATFAGEQFAAVGEAAAKVATGFPDKAG